MSNAVRIIRALAYADGVTPGSIFNDRLKDGRRSVKVWFWEHKDYLRAKAVLASAGMDAVIVKRPKPYDTRYRMWVAQCKWVVGCMVQTQSELRLTLFFSNIDHFRTENDLFEYGVDPMDWYVWFGIGMAMFGFGFGMVLGIWIGWSG